MNSKRNLSIGLQALVAVVMIALLVVACGGKGGAVTPLSVSAVSYYVDAAKGNDSNLGTFDQPFLTIQKCAMKAAAGEVCQIRTGTYTEAAAVSGVAPKSGVVITSYPGDLVTVDGSDRITTVWTLVPGSTTIYSTSAVMGTGDTNQVFVRDPLLPEERQMMTEARWPNGDDLFHVNWAKAQSGTIAIGTMGAQVVADSRLPILPSNGWVGAKIHLWSGNDPWATQTGTVTASLVQIGGTSLTISLDGASDSPNIVPQVDGYYYLFGTLAALDAPGEWFYDKVAQVLYFRPPAGVNPNPNSLEVRVKHRPFAFNLSGASNVTIQNIKLFASTINTDASSTHNTISGITAIYPSHYTTLGTNTPTYYLLDHVDDTGIIINGSNNVLQASTISYSAGNGVALRGSNNVVQNNLIHHVDYMANYPAGIAVYGPGHKIQNNTIYASGRNSIYINSFAFGVSPDVQPNNADISYNNLYNAMMLSRDGSAIYSGPGTFVINSRIHHNFIHDTQSLYSGPADNYALPGIYLDEGTAGWQVDQNVLWNNQGRNIFLHGRTIPPVTAATAPLSNNNISNNSIFDAGAEYNIALTDIALGNCGSTQIVNNRISVPVFQGVDIFMKGTNPTCTNANNNSTALAGANEMTATVQVGCSLPGCPISGGSVAASIATQPSSLTVFAGQSATFSVTGAGSAPLSYQWKKTVNIGGVATTANISGASGASYTTSVTALADNGAVFTVYVSNSTGSVMSNPATLTVQ